MLTVEQRKEFDRSGIVRLHGAVAPERVKEMRDCVWDAVERRAEVRRDDPGTWKAQRMIGSQELSESVNFEQLASPPVSEALDAIFGTRSWERPGQRLSMLVAFPESSDAWDVPHQGWHLDYAVVRGLEGNFAARIFVILEKLNHAGGGTLFFAGSHHLLQRLVAKRTADRIRSADARKALMRISPWAKSLFSPDGKTDRVRRFVNTSTTIDRQEVRVVEMTGEPGDVFIAHPTLLHAPSTNCASGPRVVLSGNIYRDPSIAKTVFRDDAS